MREREREQYWNNLIYFLYVWPTFRSPRTRLRNVMNAAAGVLQQPSIWITKFVRIKIDTWIVEWIVLHAIRHKWTRFLAMFGHSMLCLIIRRISHTARLTNCILKFARVMLFFGDWHWLYPVLSIYEHTVSHACIGISRSCTYSRSCKSFFCFVSLLLVSPFFFLFPSYVCTTNAKRVYVKRRHSRTRKLRPESITTNPCVESKEV